MPGTFTKINLHIVYAVKYRQGLIQKEWKEQLHRLMTSIVEENNHKLLQINSMPDHIHILIGAKTHQSIADLVRILKTRSTLWINDRRLCKTKFAWQEGYCVVSHCNEHASNVIRYIQNQEMHHKKENMREEQKRIMKDAEIEFEEKYIFHDPL